MPDADLSLVPEEPEASVLSNDQSNNNQESEMSESTEVWPLEAFIKHEPLVSAPFLNNQCKKPYTLVLDLDETLVHYLEEEH